MAPLEDVFVLFYTTELTLRPSVLRVKLFMLIVDNSTMIIFSVA